MFIYLYSLTMDNYLQLDVTLSGYVQLSNNCLNYKLPQSGNYLQTRNNDGGHFKAIEHQPMFSSIKLCAYYVPLICNLIYSVIIYKHDIDLKLYALTFKVGKYIIRHLKDPSFK